MAAKPSFDAAAAMEHFSDDDAYYQTPSGETKFMQQQNWAAIELAIGGYMTVRFTDWYAHDRDHRPASD